MGLLQRLLLYLRSIFDRFFQETDLVVPLPGSLANLFAGERLTVRDPLFSNHRTIGVVSWHVL